MSEAPNEPLEALLCPECLEDRGVSPVAHSLGAEDGRPLSTLRLATTGRKLDRDSNGLVIGSAVAAVVALCLPGATAWQTEPLRLRRPVVVAQGHLQGVGGKSRGVTAFLGIPYAAPPTGNLRWRAAQPPLRWQGVRLADRFAASCPQSFQVNQPSLTAEFLASGELSEDCLYLNVWTPARSASERHPVFVYLHGGGYDQGSSSVPIYDGHGLATKGLVVVTLNYRLGLLGFLAHPELTRESPHHASGNYGLLDKIAALQWVRQNIAAFGGDPGRVTVAGQSAGAQDVHHLSASPLAAGLFHRTIAQSGSGLSQLGNGYALRTHEAACERFVAAKGVGSLTALRELTWQELVAPLEPSAIGSGPRPSCPAAPVVDGYVLPQGVGPTYAQGRQHDVPMLTGWNADDGLAGSPITPDELRTRLSQRYRENAPRLLALYPSFATTLEATAVNRMIAQDGLRSTLYGWAVKRGLTAQTPSYTYFWTHPIPGVESDRYGAFHTAEVPYVLNNLANSPRPFASDDHRLADLASSYWVNFAKSGDPNGPDLPRWLPAAESGMTMQLDAHSRMVPAVTSDSRLKFFKGLW